MDKSKRVLNLSHADIETFEEKDFKGYAAIDVTEYCFGELEDDPWDTLRFLRALLKDSRLRLTIGGQALLGSRHFPDKIVDAFIAAAVDNGINVLRVFDALNDARNLETAAAFVKKYGAELEIGMVYAESPVHSISYFAGYAAQIAAMGADSLCIIGVSNEFVCRELTEAVGKAASISVSVSATCEKIADIALDSGAKTAEVYHPDACGEEEAEEAERVRQDAGYPPMVYPTSFTICAQAIRNIHSQNRYETVSDDFKDLILGKFGKLPMAPSPEFISEICGEEPLVLVRPADLLEPEYDLICQYTAPWFEQEEDILTYALYRGAAIVFFEKRKAQKYALDMPHAHKDRGIHTV